MRGIERGGLLITIVSTQTKKLRIKGWKAFDYFPCNGFLITIFSLASQKISLDIVFSFKFNVRQRIIIIKLRLFMSERLFSPLNRNEGAMNITFYDQEKLDV